MELHNNIASKAYDVLIIGGGISGVSLAREYRIKGILRRAVGEE